MTLLLHSVWVKRKHGILCTSVGIRVGNTELASSLKYQIQLAKR